MDNADLIIRDKNTGEHMTLSNFTKGIALTRGPASYCQDGLATVVDCGFMRDPRFLAAYAAKQRADNNPPGSMEIHWRVYTECWVANHVKDLEGDFVECGVKRGGSVMPVMSYIDFPSTGKTFWLLDTFCGLAMELVSDEEQRMGIGTRYNRDFSDHYADVVALFEPYDCVHIIKGRVPDTLDRVTADKICYLLLDMNCAAPEIAAAEHFWDRLVGGAVMILDDYAWKTHPVQKIEFDAFAADRGVEVLTLPTGQGLIFKP